MTNFLYLIHLNLIINTWQYILKAMCLKYLRNQISSIGLWIYTLGDAFIGSTFNNMNIINQTKCYILQIGTSKILMERKYLCDSEDTTTTRAGADRRSTSCRHWTSRKWPKWQIWKVVSRPSSVKLQGWVKTAALQTKMCRGLKEGNVKTFDWLSIEKKEGTTILDMNFREKGVRLDQ